ncbi:MAG TPA: universal stress protein [Terriglobia bacterium]|nr:universal stress protein [Terriglobia bacterium]
MREPGVVVALRDGDHVEELMKLACQMSRGTNAPLIALHVVEVSLALDLDADSEVLDRDGKAILARAREVASRLLSKEISTRLLRAREAGPAIVSEAMDQGADLLILGYHQKPVIREAMLGSTVQHVARHAPCRVIIQVLPSKRS